MDHGPIKFFVSLDPGLPIANLRYYKIPIIPQAILGPEFPVGLLAVLLPRPVVFNFTASIVTRKCMAFKIQSV